MGLQAVVDQEGHGGHMGQRRRGALGSERSAPVSAYSERQRDSCGHPSGQGRPGGGQSPW